MLSSDRLIVPTNTLQDPFIPLSQKFEFLSPFEQIQQLKSQITNPGPIEMLAELSDSSSDSFSFLTLPQSQTQLMLLPVKNKTNHTILPTEQKIPSPTVIDQEDPRPIVDVLIVNETQKSGKGKATIKGGMEISGPSHTHRLSLDDIYYSAESELGQLDLGKMDIDRMKVTQQSSDSSLPMDHLEKKMGKR